MFIIGIAFLVIDTFSDRKSYNQSKKPDMQKVITKKLMRILMQNLIKNRKTKPQKLPKKPKNPNPKRLRYQNNQNP
jgi:hypothetical protein